MKAEEMYKRSMKNGTPKLKRSLEVIKLVCDEIQGKGQKIYSAKVGKFCEENYGSPKLQSIRNNKTLLTYINLRGQEQEIKSQGITSNKEDLGLLDELLEYKRENECLRKLLKTLKVKR